MSHERGSGSSDMSGSDTDQTVEIIAIGTELLIGRVQDTNSSWLAERMSAAGASIARITIVGDGLEELTAAFTEAVTRNPYMVVCTGGLGPTSDDRTVEVLASLWGVNIVQDESTLAEYSKSRGVSGVEQLPWHLRKMSCVPEGSEVMSNPNGWAPAFMFSSLRTKFLAMPGPPHEVKEIYRVHVHHRIVEYFNHKSASQRIVIKMSEAELSPIIERVVREFPGSYLKAYVALREPGGLPVDIVVQAGSQVNAMKKLSHVLQMLQGLVGEACHEVDTHR